MKYLLLIVLLSFTLLSGCNSTQQEYREPEEYKDPNEIEEPEADITALVDDQHYTMYVIEKEDYIDIGFPYNDTDNFWIEFGYAGRNNLYSLAAIYIAPLDKDYQAENYKKDYIKSYQCGTDWIGPYIVKQEDIEIPISPRFTGGWHGANKDGTGEPTAKTVDYSIEINAVRINDGSLLASSVDLSIVNEIQGYNTIQDKQAIILETVKYHITPNTIEVQVTIKSLEDVIIERYYGLQTENAMFPNGKIVYGETDMEYDVKKYSASNLKQEDFRLNELMITSGDNQHRLLVQLEEYGLGRFQYIGDKKPYAFTTGSGKSYFNLVNGIPLQLNKGNETGWKGRYVFEYIENDGVSNEE